MKNYRNIETVYTVTANEPLTHKTWRMRLSGDTSELTRAGQFVNLMIDGKYLRRPISVSDYNSGELMLLYDVVGSGTKTMSEMKPGTEINTLTGLGNGFTEDMDTEHPVLLGGGIGCAPLLNLARKLLARGITPTVILGFNTAQDVAMKEDFKEIGLDAIICTVDGSDGVKGFVTDAINALPFRPDYFYACGPMPMLRAVCTGLDFPGEVSLESRMGCGFGACMCCSIETKDSAKRICKDGPVFSKDELIWK
ncbi:MAG: dihydroorotate dehydrogenase electron transfer subunit [Muribaculaceae bacterium]|nr:dihydroorotate dehydrogenase electron transfer subunit [Muribaculaceae bacterium]